MNIFNVGLESWNIIYVKLNWVAVIILVIAILIVSFMIKKCANIAKKHSITIDEVNLGIIVAQLSRQKSKIFIMN